ALPAEAGLVFRRARRAVTTALQIRTIKSRPAANLKIAICYHPPRRRFRARPTFTRLPAAARGRPPLFCVHWIAASAHVRSWRIAQILAAVPELVRGSGLSGSRSIGGAGMILRQLVNLTV